MCPFITISNIETPVSTTFSYEVQGLLGLYPFFILF